MTITEQFCKIIRERSAEHNSASKLLHKNGNFGQVISILRQELDSLVRVVFLLSKDLATREYFMSQTLNNIKWVQPSSRTVITDRDMVNLANGLIGWTNSVYKLGCAFIHLSPLVNYKNENPFLKLTKEEVCHIKRHLYKYHEFNLSDELTITTIVPYLPRVLEKVTDNLECYTVQLEKGEILDMDEI